MSKIVFIFALARTDKLRIAVLVFIVVIVLIFPCQAKNRIRLLTKDRYVRGEIN